MKEESPTLVTFTDSDGDPAAMEAFPVVETVLISGKGNPADGVAFTREQAAKVAAYLLRFYTTGLLTKVEPWREALSAVVKVAAWTDHGGGAFTSIPEQEGDPVWEVMALREFGLARIEGGHRQHVGPVVVELLAAHAHAMNLAWDLFRATMGRGSKVEVDWGSCAVVWTLPELPALLEQAAQVNPKNLIRVYGVATAKGMAWTRIAPCGPNAPQEVRDLLDGEETVVIRFGWMTETALVALPEFGGF